MPQIGAVAIPFIDVNRSRTVRQKAPRPDSIFAAYTFIGTAHALRRDVFLRLDGYRDALVHQGEEEDYSIRMLNAGWITRCGNADPIHHFESPRRSWSRMDYYGARNKILYAWQNVPWPYFPAHVLLTTALMASSHACAVAIVHAAARHRRRLSTYYALENFPGILVRPETVQAGPPTETARRHFSRTKLLIACRPLARRFVKNDHCIVTTVS